MRTKRRNRVIFVSSLVASLSVAFIFIVLAMNKNVDFYYTPSDLTSSKIINKDSLRIGGLVQEDSIKISKDSLKTNFLVTDLENSIEVYYEGILPNLFKENSGVIARGFYDYSDGIFYAKEILAKHDENYIPKEVKKALVNDS